MPSRHSGWTLIETLVSLSIISLLMALLVPSLSSMRRNAHIMKDLANIRTHITIVDLYAADYSDCHPYFVRPDATVNIIRLQGDDYVTISVYFLASMTWNYALADSYYEGDKNNCAFFPSGRSPCGGAPFLMSCTLFAAPEYWNQETRIGIDQLRATRRHEIRYPSDKIMFSSVSPFSVDQPAASSIAQLRVPAGSCDGSAAAFQLTAFRPGIENGEGSFSTTAHHFDWGVGGHTVDGVRGRDLSR